MGSDLANIQLNPTPQQPYSFLIKMSPEELEHLQDMIRERKTLRHPTLCIVSTASPLQEEVNGVFCETMSQVVINYEPFDNLLLSLFVSGTYILNSFLPSVDGLILSVMLEGALLMLWFGVYGNWLFVHAINSNTLLGVLSFHFAVVVTLVQAYFCGYDLGVNDIATLFLSWGVSLLSLNMFSQKWELWPGELDWAGLKRYYLRIQGLLNTKKEDLQNDSYFEGIYYGHSLICPSINCKIGQKVLYDPLTFEELNSSDTKFNKETRFKYLIKCLFEGLLASHPKDTALMLAYLDFNLVEFGNPKAIDFYLEALGTVELRLLDRIQLHKLKTCFRGRVDLVT